MEPPPSPTQRDDRIARAAERLRAAEARVSQAQEMLTVARERVAIARLALQEAEAQDNDRPPTGEP